jgi:phage terminase large subunit-like protein
MDAAGFIETTLVNPETGALFVLTEAEREFLAHAFELTPDGRLRYPELVFSAIKKSGKTAFAAMLVIYVITVLGGRYAEAWLCANDYEQAAGRVYQAAARIVEASPLLSLDATVTQNKITFGSTGSTITAIASDYAGAAGANPTITVFDELWGYVSERSHRLWDEMIPPPTRRIACRLTVTYAGYEGESELLEGIYKRGMAGEPIGPSLHRNGGLLMAWHTKPVAPWQTAEWLAQMREQHRPNAYLRQIENQWVTTEESFVPVEWWDRAVDPAATPRHADKRLDVWLGVDASVKRDSTAIVACAYDRAARKVQLVTHRIFQPSRDNPLDFEDTIERTVEDLAGRFRVKEVRYDPYQMAATAQRLVARGVPMVEFPQTVGNLTEASQNLYELLKSAALVAYPDPDIRLAVQRAVAVEMPRGWKITKTTAGHKIDVVVALGMAALGAVGAAGKRGVPWTNQICEQIIAASEADAARGSSFDQRFWNMHATSGPPR